MELFENKVGRPSKETLVKRKIIRIIMVFVSIAIIIGSFYLGYYGTQMLRGAVATITVSSSPKAGDKVVLNGTPIYVSATIKTKASTKSGEYYLNDSSIKNNRMRIVKNKKDVGKVLKVVGWINVKKNITTTTKKVTTTTKKTTTKKITTTTTKKISFIANEEVKLSSTKVYASATTKTKKATKSGKYYIYKDPTIKSNRVRISTKKNGSSYGWVDVKSISKVTSPQTAKSTTTTALKIFTLSCPATIAVNNEGKCTTNTAGVKISITKSNLKSGYNSSYTTTSSDKTKVFKYSKAQKVTVTATKSGYKTISKNILISQDENVVVSKNKNMVVTYSEEYIHAGDSSKLRVVLTNSNDSYKVSSNNTNIVSVKSSGDEIILSGKKSGTVNIIIVSNLTGEKVVGTFIVLDSNVPKMSEVFSNRKTYATNMKFNGIINTIPVFVDKNCTNNTYLNAYINEIKKLKNYEAKFVDSINLVSSTAFHYIYPSKSRDTYANTVTNSSGKNSYINIKCDINPQKEELVLHETIHAADYYYYSLNKKHLSTELFKDSGIYKKYCNGYYSKYSDGKKVLNDYACTLYPKSSNPNAPLEFLSEAYIAQYGSKDGYVPKDVISKLQTAVSKMKNLKK